MNRLDRAAMKLVVAVACGTFLACCWFLSNKRLLFSLLVAFVFMMLPHNALASCTTYSIYGPDGRVQLCTSCCTNGVCNVNCF